MSKSTAFQLGFNLGEALKTAIGVVRLGIAVVQERRNPSSVVEGWPDSYTLSLEKPTFVRMGQNLRAWQATHLKVVRQPKLTWEVLLLTWDGNRK